MNPKDFSPSSPGRLVPTVEGAMAFVPEPIPRKLVLAPPTIRLLSEADHSMGRLAGVVSRLVNPYLVAYPLMRREAILSSRIEGTYTTAEDLVLMEAAPTERPPVPLHSREADTREVVNYIRAMEYGLKRLKQMPLSLRVIREMHDVLLRGVRGDQERPGEFRVIQNFIGRRSDTIANARFVPPPVPEMLTALDDLERYLHEETADSPPLLVRLALIHYQFETIHPFRDGNGRIGRVLLPLMLCSTGKIGEPTLYLSGYFDHHREDYMDLLLRVSLRGDWTAWIDFFLQAVAVCANESREQAEGLINLLERYLARFRSARSSALLQTLIEELFRLPSMSIGDAVTLLKVSPATASANLKKLAAAGIVREITGRRKGQRYIADEIVSFSKDVATAAPTPPEEQQVTRTASE
jgi:Fic family protein